MALPTKLDAVNEIIEATSNTALAALSGGTPLKIEKIALDALARQTEILMDEQDWKENYEEKVPFTADGAGLVVLATAANMDILQVTLNEANPPAPTGTIDVIMRRRAPASDTQDWMLYDTINKTFNLTPNAIYYLNVRRLRDFTDLTLPYRRVIIERAKARVLHNHKGSETKYRDAVAEAGVAYGNLIDTQLALGGLRAQRRVRSRENVLDNPYAGAMMTGVFPWLLR